MLKKIAIADLRLGMYLHALEGSWLDHPFWRNKFLLEDQGDWAALQASGVSECWIDSGKGLDVVEPPPPSPPRTDVPRQARTAAAEVSPDQPPVRDPAMPNSRSPQAAVPPPSASFEEEIETAARLCRHSKKEVQRLFGELRMGKALNAQSFQPMVEELAASVFRNPGALVSLARLKSKDDYSYMHSVAVCALMIALGRELGMDAAECREAGLAGLLHDVGKALMPLDVLNKPGKLSEAEFAVMRLHPVRGHAVLAESGTAGAIALDVCLHHHERVDGAGYPEGLAGSAISRIARMGAICDVYDAISSNRPYKTAWDPADSISRMASWKGQFDPTLFAVFVRSLGIYPTGSLVRMKSGRLAVVVEQHRTNITAPTVKVFFSTKSNMPITVSRIDLARPDANDAIASRESRSAWNFPHLETLWIGDGARH